MEKNRYLSKYTQEQIQHLIEGVYKGDPMFSKGNIHNTRLSIKRLRAVYYFLDFLFPELSFQKTFSPILKQVFSPLGLIREAQINIGLNDRFVRNHKLQHQINKHLKNKIAEYKSEILHKRDKYNLKRCVASSAEVKKVEHTLSPKSLVKRYLDLTKTLHKQNKKLILNDDEAAIHHMRKNLKIISYTSNIISSLSPKAHHYSETTTPLEKQVGKWHDIDCFEHYLEQNFPLKSEKVVATLQQLKTKELNNIRKQYKAFSPAL